jgi:hypothetical protein
MSFKDPIEIPNEFLSQAAAAAPKRGWFGRTAPARKPAAAAAATESKAWGGGMFSFMSRTKPAAEGAKEEVKAEGEVRSPWMGVGGPNSCW